MDEITIRIGDVDFCLSVDEAERCAVELAAAAYWARHEGTQ